MNVKSKITLTVMQFFKRYGKIILGALAIWLVLFLANMYIKNRPKEYKATSQYKPNEPIMDEGLTVPKKEVNSINQTIDTYFNFCNSKEYENAFNMLTDDCKTSLYNNNLEEFKTYIDNIYTGKKIYHIQNYSNTKNIYIYEMNILDDITATGTTGDYNTYKEKIAVHNLDGEKKISIKGYIGKTTLEKETEDDNIKVKVLYKEMSYEREEYTLEIRNKIDRYILISDGTNNKQTSLNLGDQYRNELNGTMQSIGLFPGQTRTIKLLFTKYFDDGVSPTEINFNNIRILSEAHSGTIPDESILKSYSLNIKLK